MKNQLLEILRFGCVGVASMLVHFTVVSMLVPSGADPLIANILAFAVAFQISFFGHRHWTFGKKQEAGQYPRMLTVSLVGFVVNETLYAFLLRHSHLDYQTALAIVLVTVATGTYLGSRFWAFKANDPTS